MLTMLCPVLTVRPSGRIQNRFFVQLLCSVGKKKSHFTSLLLFPETSQINCCVVEMDGDVVWEQAASSSGWRATKSLMKETSVWTALICTIHISLVLFCKELLFVVVYFFIHLSSNLYLIKYKYRCFHYYSPRPCSQRWEASWDVCLCRKKGNGKKSTEMYRDIDIWQVLWNWSVKDVMFVTAWGERVPYILHYVSKEASLHVALEAFKSSFTPLKQN